jgi:beta-N-acetylhexosaminidase
MKYFFLFFICIFSACQSKSERIVSMKEKLRNDSASVTQQLVVDARKGQQDAISVFIESLADEQKIAQLFLVNIGGDRSYEPAEKSGALYGKPDAGHPIVPGGCLLFSFNIGQTPEQVRSFTDSIQNYCRLRGLVPPYISLDQEGGDVNRLRHITSRLPSARSVAAAGDVAAAYQLYLAQAQQLHALGIHLNLAPVTEAGTSQNSHFLGDRSFGSVDTVIRYGAAAVCAYEIGGVGTVLKHFPGNTDTDPHTGLPEIKTDKQNLDALYIQPFASVLKRNPSGILMSHARVSSLDADLPACLSYQWVTGVLRNQLHYTGLIFSDDIFMKALSDNGFPPEKAAIAALDAGVDCLMFSGKTYGAIAGSIMQKCVADPIFSLKVADAVRRVIEFKIAHGILVLRYDGKNHYTIIIPSALEKKDNWKEEFQLAYIRGSQLAVSANTGIVHK